MCLRFLRIILPAFCLLLFALPLPAAHAAGCVWLRNSDSDPDRPDVYFDHYVRFPSSNFISGPHPLYADASCQTSHPPLPIVEHFEPGAVHTSSANKAWSICDANISQPIQRVLRVASADVFRCLVSGEGENKPKQRRATLGHRINFPDAESALAACQAFWPATNEVIPFGPAGDDWECNYVWYETSGGGRSGGSSGGGRPAPPLLPLTGLRLDAFDGMGSGIEFKRIDHYGVGVAEVINMGFLDAVDVWSHVGRGFSVCFPQAGHIVFLDATTAPRTLMDVENVLVDGFTCAAMDRAGTMVLVQQGAPATAPPATPTRRPGTNDSVDDAIALEDCTITTLVNLRIREAPWGKFLAVIPANTEVPATARTKSWFNVAYEEWEGWSAAWLVHSDGGCEWAEAD